jgi:hypothetical protein
MASDGPWVELNPGVFREEYYDNTVTAGTQYYYRLQAFWKDGAHSANSEIVSCISKSSSVGTVYLNPSLIVANQGTSLILDMYVNTGSEKLRNFDIELNFDTNALIYSSTSHGAEGLSTVINSQTPGKIIFSGSHYAGQGPSTSLHILQITFYALTKGITEPNLTINQLVYLSSATIGTPLVLSAHIEVQ